ncbi:aldo/keto reductase [Gluconacetobacter entanii]|uniref:aldo/keto reductase n=1 Tax=Gluconacetobacter entanii TaxID=108528 RepID=UPI001C936FE7|nr:aldo/keto reductase [Gluconacetobacter entanii]MBY4639367.1 aldo/keto reductase [Gluconacetobacter entanii]MCW4580285.1 aldo/keto reductase [Gluconacetobacter entanii]MCW4583649.1 aldo/keto reductase [Gluconacetobacter entanii]MCW4586961.1 aldo/keto reductase [Gluconacetobacter entanii]
MKNVTFPDGITVPALGMGTWNLGDDEARRDAEIRSIRMGLDAGLRVVDTAEMYGSGRSERLVGQAIAGRRDDVYLVDKVLPSNASRRGVHDACAASLKLLGTDHLDLYLLHWRGSIPLEETVAGFEDLKRAGMIRAWGVSNFDVDDMRELARIHTPDPCCANQILYSLDYRGVEYDLLAHDRAEGIVTMAYSPLGQGGELLRAPVLKRVAARHETSLGPATPAQVALAWVLRQPGVLAIPKAGSPAHQRENMAAVELELTKADLAEIDDAIPPPHRKVSLAMI